LPRVVFIGAPEADAASFETRLRAEMPGIELFATNDRSLAMTQLGVAEVLIGHHFQFDDELLERAPRLRWIQSLTSGTDAIVELAALRPEVLLTSTRGMHGPQMSELVLLCMLALNRDFPRMQRNQRAHRWQRWPQSLLSGKSVVVVGVGAIAGMLAPRCKAFGMQVFGVTASPRAQPGFDGMFTRAELPQAAALADFLVLVVPYSADTDTLIDATVLAAMKPSAFLINVARGGVLDEQALLAAVRERRIAGAALDVFRHSPLPAEDPLWDEERIIITPLVGGMSDVYLDQCYPIVLSNLRHFLAGHPERMLNLVAR
jgi:phosphoglycerate dehydrogenase-like enzyme